MRPLRRLLKCSWADKYLLIQVALLVGVTRLGLWLLPFKTVQRLLAGSSKKPVRRHIDPTIYPERVAWAVRAVGRRLLGEKPCLPQALVVHWLLKRNGYTPALHIGVTRDAQGQFLAHAWVEHQADIIMGGRSSTAIYTPLWKMEEGQP